MIRMMTALLVAGALVPTAAGFGADMLLPPTEEGAKAALEASPRHHEYVKIPLADSTTMNAWMAWPERKDKAPVVIVIHEVFGLTEWIRSVTDRFAAEGFIAIVPDLLSGRGLNGGGSEDFPDRDAAIKATRDLTGETVTARLNATRDFAAALPAAARKFGTAGFCWGGGQSFRYATERPDLGAAVVFYGVSPADSTLSTVRAPVLGLYGSDDARINVTVPPAEAAMKKLGREYTALTFEGAGHGFLRNQDGRDGANLEAARAAWPATVAFLKKHLE